MGNMNGHGIYQELGVKIDGLTIRAPWNQTFYDILRELYSEEEADFIVKMPNVLSTIERIEKSQNMKRSDWRDYLRA